MKVWVFIIFRLIYNTAQIFEFVFLGLGITSSTSKNKVPPKPQNSLITPSITGVGIYHKGSIGYGGFVGFLVKTLDFSSHLLPDYQNDNGDQRRSNDENEKLILREVMKYDFSANQNL